MSLFNMKNYNDDKNDIVEMIHNYYYQFLAPISLREKGRGGREDRIRV